MRYQVETSQSPMDERLHPDENIGSFYNMEPTLQIEKYKNTSILWTLDFDGAHSSSRYATKITLIEPSKEAT
jgi:hypothetical protein